MECDRLTLSISLATLLDNPSLAVAWNNLLLACLSIWIGAHLTVRISRQLVLWDAHVHVRQSHVHHWHVVLVPELRLRVWVIRRCTLWWLLLLLLLLWLLMHRSLSARWVEWWNASLKSRRTRIASCNGVDRARWLWWAGDLSAVWGLESCRRNTTQVSLVVLEVLLSMRLLWCGVDVVRLHRWNSAGREGRLQLRWCQRVAV